MEDGNIRFYVSNQGVLFQQNGNSRFEVPQGSGIHSILASGIWIAGKDGAQGKRVSVATYDTSATDFQPGPIDRSTGLPDLPSDWNFVWKTNAGQISNHKTQYNKIGYQTPWGIQRWPGSNLKQGDFNPILAPFIDLNSNQLYEPALGETPYIKGNEASYFILNDLVTSNRQGSAQGLGVEIYGMVYTEKAFPNVVFVQYQIINRSFNQYDSVFVGIFTDFLLGNPFDNYTATDSARHLLFTYNSLAHDSFGYGNNPPVMGVKFLRRNLSKSISFNWDLTDHQGWPQNPEDYFGYLNAHFKDGSELTDPVSGQKDYIYLGDPCNGSGWTEYGSSGNVPGRRNMLGSVGPLTLQRNEVISIDLAYIFSRNSSELLTPICGFYDDADLVQYYWDNTLSAQRPQRRSPEILTYPNPAQQTVYWQLNDNTVIEHVVLMDLNGKQHTLHPEGNRADVSAFPAGVYFLILSDIEGTQYRKRIVIMK